MNNATVLPLFAFFVLLLTACSGITHDRQDDSVSDVQLFNGKNITEETHPHVVFIGGCTATFVSDTTLITAGHCVGRGSSVSVTRRIRARSLKVIHHPRYSGTGVNDVAIALFPSGTAQATAPVFSGTLTTGEDVFAVGYGCTNGGGSGGTKREGATKIASLRGGVIGLQRSGNAPGSGSDVTLCPGDSGGPLFRNGAVIGIASYWDGGAGRSSGHADLTAPSNISFMKSVVQQHGAVIPGLDGPITPPGGGLPNSPSQIFAALGDSSGQAWDLLSSAPASAAGMVVCAGRVTAACNAATAGAMRSTGRAEVAGKAIFRFSNPIDPTTTPELVLAALDTSGNVASVRAVRFSPR